MGFNYRSYLLFHAGPGHWAWVNWTGGIHTISGLRLIPLAGTVFDLGVLRVVKNQKGKSRLIVERRSNGKKHHSLLVHRVSVLPFGERVSFASQDPVYGSKCS